MRIVFLSRWQPAPADNGSKIRISNLLAQLGRRHEVTLLTFADPTDRFDDVARETLARSCRNVQVFPYKEFQPSSRRAVAGAFSSQPRYLSDTFSEELLGALDDVLARQSTDLIIASQLAMLPYAARCRAWPCLLEELELSVFHDAAYHRPGSYAGLRARLTWLKLAQYLRRTVSGFDACTVVSDAERQLVRGVAPGYGPVHVVPNAVAAAQYLGEYGESAPDSLVFAGSLTYAPNLQGARWFLASVYPRIRERVPTAHLRMTGSTRGVDLKTLGPHEGYELTGYVPDVRPVVAQSWVSVVPLLTGGGTRLKILESMALGTPVVSTSKGAEGLDVTHGDDILIADEPAEFADHVRAVLQNPALRARLAARGRDLVRSRYDWDVVGPRFCEIVEQAAARRTVALAGGAR